MKIRSRVIGIAAAVCYIFNDHQIVVKVVGIKGKDRAEHYEVEMATKENDRHNAKM